MFAFYCGPHEIVGEGVGIDENGAVGIFVHSPFVEAVRSSGYRPDLADARPLTPAARAMLATARKRGRR